MKKQIFLGLVICVMLSIGSITILKINSLNHYKNSNGFYRIFNSQVYNFKYLDLHYNSYYLAGMNSKKIFLGNSTGTSNIIITDYGLSDTLHKKLKNPKKLRVAWRAAQLRVNYPDIYFYERESPMILFGKFPSLQLIENYDLGNTNFERLLPISNETFALISFDTILQQNRLAIKKKENPQLITSDTLILKKQVDGRFCIDGMLLYAPEMEKIVYLYYYRNEIICMDTNLNVTYTAHTIDTINLAQINLDTIQSEKKVTFSSPPLIVNRNSCVYKNKLFVHSNLIADNEEPSMFKQNSVIDIYSLENGKYESSFYVPNFKNKKVNHFQVFNEKLVVIFDRYLASFDLKTLRHYPPAY